MARYCFHFPFFISCLAFSGFYIVFLFNIARNDLKAFWQTSIRFDIRDYQNISLTKQYLSNLASNLSFQMKLHATILQDCSPFWPFLSTPPYIGVKCLKKALASVYEDWTATLSKRKTRKPPGTSSLSFLTDTGSPGGLLVLIFAGYVWPLRAPTPLQSILWPIIHPILVTFGQICNFCVPNLVTFYLRIYLILNEEHLPGL